MTYNLSLMWANDGHAQNSPIFWCSGGIRIVTLNQIQQELCDKKQEKMAKIEG